MQVLVTHRSGGVRQRISKILSSLGHEVSSAETADQAMTCIQSSSPPEVAIIEILWPGYAEAIGALARASRHIYTVGLLVSVEAARVQAAFDAGADDVMSVHASHAEVAGRVDALKRIRLWISTMGDDFGAGDARKFNIDNLIIMKSFGEMLGLEFSEMLGQPLTSVEASQVPPLHHCAEMSLALTAENVSLQLGIGMPETAVGPFSETLFGEAVPAEVVTDALREFTNAGGGVIKRVALSKGHTFSMGLPEDSLLTAPPTNANRCRIFTSLFDLFIWVSVARAQPTRVMVSSVREGMVLVREVRSESGALLLAAGTLLTERTVERLSKILGPSTHVEVTRAA